MFILHREKVSLSSVFFVFFRHIYIHASRLLQRVGRQALKGLNFFDYFQPQSTCEVALHPLQCSALCTGGLGLSLNWLDIRPMDFSKRFWQLVILKYSRKFCFKLFE